MVMCMLRQQCKKEKRSNQLYVPSMWGHHAFPIAKLDDWEVAKCYQQDVMQIFCCTRLWSHHTGYSNMSLNASILSYPKVAYSNFNKLDCYNISYLFIWTSLVLHMKLCKLHMNMNIFNLLKVVWICLYVESCN